MEMFKLSPEILSEEDIKNNSVIIDEDIDDEDDIEEEEDAAEGTTPIPDAFKNAFD